MTCHPKENYGYRTPPGKGFPHVVAPVVPQWPLHPPSGQSLEQPPGEGCREGGREGGREERGDRQTDRQTDRQKEGERELLETIFHNFAMYGI